MGSYSFMLLTYVRLAPLFTKIALFSVGLKGTQKTKTLFELKSPVFIQPREQQRSEFQLKELQKIGFSLHLLVLEIIRMSESVFKLLPFHEQFCGNSKTSKLAPFFDNSFFKAVILFQKSKLPMASKYFYFKK